MKDQYRIEALAGDHDRSNFDSGSALLDRYFREQVTQDIKRRITTCFVALGANTGEVAGFYTLTATSIALDALAPEIVRKLPRYPVVPAALLGRWLRRFDRGDRQRPWLRRGAIALRAWLAQMRGGRHVFSQSRKLAASSIAGVGRKDKLREVFLSVPHHKASWWEGR